MVSVVLAEEVRKVLTAECCVICGNEQHHCEDCDYVKITKHVPDNEMPSKAKLTIPDFLQLQILTDGSYSVITKSLISKGTQFGPFQAEKIQTLNPQVSFPLKIFMSDEKGNWEYYLDVTDENKCSWLIFVSPAEHFEEQNLVCYQKDEEIYYITVKDIEAGGTLKVWYSPYYACKMNKPVLTRKTDVDPLKNVDINNLIKKQQKIMERKIWTCKFCSQMENNIVPFAKHILKHYTAQLRKMCEICKKSFGAKKSLQSHLKIVHNSSFPTSQAKPSKIFEPTAKIHCKDVALGGPLLNDMFTDSSDLQQADLNQFELNIDNQNLLLDSDNLIVENLLNENVKDLDHFNFEIDDSQKQFICDICLKQFTKVKLLIIHLRHHTGEFACAKCLKIFCRRENLKSHVCNVSSHHNCTWCDKSFTQRKYLSRHLEAKHYKKFKCSSCNKSYYSNKELLEHNCSKIPITEKEKFVCPICDKEFYRNTYLRKHLKVHAQRTKMQKPGFVCEICGLSLETRNSYYLHKKNHKEPTYFCEICDKKFYRQDSLKQHQLSHLKTPEVQCSVCTKSFKTKKILASHMKYHSNDKAHRCHLCDSNFKQRANLNRHLKSAHKDNKIKNRCITVECYSCPICSKAIKLRSSLLRHVRKVHSDIKVDLSCVTPKISINTVQITPIENIKKVKKNNKKKKTTHKDSLCEDAMSNSLENELDAQMNNLLTSAENNSAIHKQAVDNLVKELDMGTKKDLKEHREVCLSIPDLIGDQEITLDKNAYILDNGTIVQPQKDTDNVVIYVLDQGFS